MLAEWTGLEPATPGVTGRYSNQLNYHSNRLAVPASLRRTIRLNRSTLGARSRHRIDHLASPRGFEPL